MWWCCRITTFDVLHSYQIFKFCDFNKEHTSSLKIWIMIETRSSIFKGFNINILDEYFIVYRSALVGI